MLARSVQSRIRRRDTATRLLEQLQEFLEAACSIAVGRQKPWASITFTGTRYRFEISNIAAKKSEFIQSRLDKLSDYEFTLPGQFVADILVQQTGTDDIAYQIDILAIADPVSDENSDPLETG